MSHAKKVIAGLNIQWPWSELIVSGKKNLETRSYPIPKKHVGKEIAIIETPGPKGKKEAGILKARIIGTVIFSGSFKYDTKKQWLNDYKRHLVTDSDPVFSFKDGEEKWGWEVLKVEILKKHLEAPKSRGIVFATECSLTID